MRKKNKTEKQETHCARRLEDTTGFDLVQERIKYLRDNTDFVSTLFETLIGYAIIASDFDGNVIAYNKGAQHMYGYTPEEIIGKKNIEIFYPEDFVQAEGLQRIIDDLIGKEGFSYEGEKVRKNGERFPANILFTLTKDKNARVVGFIEIVEDLTKRKQAEEKEKERERLEAMKKQSKAQIEQLKRELDSLARLHGLPKAPLTTRMFGMLSLREGAPHVFEKLVECYKDLVDLALEQQAFKVEHKVSEKLCSMAEEMGFMKAGPRDVVEIHTAALGRKTSKATPQKAQAVTEEGRLLVLELMGHLTSYYQKSSIGSQILKNGRITTYDD